MKIENRILIAVGLEELLNFTKYEELEARIKANLQEVLKFEADLRNQHFLGTEICDILLSFSGDLLKKILVSSVVLYIW